MSRRGGDISLFVGRLSKNCRTQDVEDIFEAYGKITRCDVKYGAEMAYAFIDFEDRHDAEDAIRGEHGRDIQGSTIIVEYAKGTPRRSGGEPVRGGGGYRGGGGGGGGGGRNDDDCYKCGRSGHWARDCPDDKSYGFRRDRDRSPRRGGRSNRSRSRSPRRSRQRTRSISRSRSRSR